jgi:RNA polymerase sigma factor (sigma-70 family)
MAADAGLAAVVRRLGGPDAAGGRTDGDLLRAFLDRDDEAAFAALVRRHGPLVLGVCRRALGHAQDAEDAFQATFLLLARNARSIRDRGALPSWLHGVAYRMATNAKRAAARRARHEAAASPPRPAPAAVEAAARELQAVLDEEVGRLPEPLRVPFVVCCLEGRGCAEAGRALGLTEATVWGRLSRARRLLRDRLSRRGVSLGAVLAAAAVSSGLTAAVPGPLVRAVARAAADGGSGVGGAVPPEVSALLVGAHRAMSAGYLKLAAALTLMAAAGAAGAALWAGAGAAAQPPGPAAAAPAGGTGPEQAAARTTDLHGDPLPAGARVRLGTSRFRHGSMVTAVHYASGGTTIVSCGFDKALRVWEVATGRELARLDHPQLGSVAAAAGSPDGKLVAVLGHSGEVFLADVPGRRLTRPEWQPRGQNTALALSPDGKVLAVGEGDATVGLWDVAAGKLLHQLRGHTGAVRAAAFSPDGKTVAAGGDDGTLRLWDAATGAEALRLEAGEPVRAVAFSPDGRALAGGGGKEDQGGSADRQFGRVHLWALPDGKPLHALGSHYPYVAAVAFSPDGKTVASAARGDVVSLWDVATGKQLRRARAFAQAVAFSPDGKTVATGGNDCSVRLWDPATGAERDPGRPGHAGRVSAVAAPRDGRVVATAGGDALVRLWDPRTGRELRSVDASSTWFLGTGAVALSPDGSRLATDKGVWDTASGKFLSGGGGRRTAFRDQDYSISAVAFSPDGMTVAMATRDPGAAGRDRTIRLWEAATAREVRGFGADRVFSLAYAPDGNTLAAGNADGTVGFWDPATGALLRRSAAHGREVNSVAFSPDGTLVASSTFDGDVVLTDAATGRGVRRLDQFRPPGISPVNVLAVAFAPDGRSLASAEQPFTSDGGACVTLWDVSTGTVRLRLAGHQGDVNGLAFVGDARTLVTGSTDTTALVWDLAAAGATGGPAAAADVGRLWEDLAGDDAARAYRALCRLALAPDLAAGAVKDRLRPVPKADAARVARLIRDLDSEAFATRERASADLAREGPAAEPAVRQALVGGPTAEAAARLRRVLSRLEGGPDARRADRAVELLELIDTPAGRGVLEALAGGAAGARLTGAAEKAVSRLKGRVSTSK